MVKRHILFDPYVEVMFLYVTQIIFLSWIKPVCIQFFFYVGSLTKVKDPSPHNSLHIAWAADIVINMN